MSDVNEIIESVSEAERMRGAYIDSQEYARDCRFLINKLSEKEAEIKRLNEERNKYREEAANERKLTESIVAEREQLIIDNELLTDQLNQSCELWVCPTCGFGFDSKHEDVDGGHSCPVCELSEIESAMSTLIAWHNREMKRMQHELNQAIEALEYILTFPYLHETDDIRAIKRTVTHTIQSIKGGESDATQTSD